MSPRFWWMDRKVAQHAGDDVARGRPACQEQAERHVEGGAHRAGLAHEVEAFLEVAARERLAAERIDHHLALRQPQP